MMMDAPLEEMQKRQFFKALKELLRSSFTLLDFNNTPLSEVFNRALNLDHQQLGIGLSPVRALAPILKMEENSFQQRIQFTLCLQFGYSNVECTQRCALCQARTHTTATCEYNLLAQKNSPAVQAIELVP
jgi:predicted nuclease with RNAse H fold